MKTIVCPLVLFLSILVSPAQDSAAKIDTLSVFKNGLAVVRMQGAIPDSGSLELQTIPDPVHGTFWIQSAKPVTARVEMKRAEAPFETQSHADLLQRLIGENVVIHTGNDMISGTVLGSPREESRQWNRDYATVDGRSGWYGWGWPLRQPNANAGNQPKLALIRTDAGKVIALHPNAIQRLEFATLPKLERVRPVLSLKSQGAAKIAVEFLTKGISWAPSYRIDLSNPDKLTIAQKATLRNELTSLREVEIRLISGFPSVKYGGIDSPLSPRTTWTNFFQQLTSASSQSQSPGVFSQIASNTVRMPQFAPAVPAEPGESVDLHFQSIGRHSLEPGESLSIPVASAEAGYERVIEWNIPDTRDAHGRYISEHERRSHPDKYEESAWDAIGFANPFDFPMTTAPAMLVANGKFQGQQDSNWTNPGVKTTVRINKALSLSTRAVEHEVPETRENLRIAGNNFYKTQVEGELSIENHRGQPVVVNVKRRFSGDLVRADGEPAQQLLEEGVYSINKRNELSWRLELAAGAKAKLVYRYAVLVDD